MRPFDVTPGDDDTATDNRKMYYPDRDNDGQGQDNADEAGQPWYTAPQCPKQGTGPGTSVAAQPPTGFVTNSKDCCDATSSAYKGATGYHTEAMPNYAHTYGSACAGTATMGFDYNCDGKAEIKSVPAWPGCGYDYGAGACGISSSVRGWTGSQPMVCGNSYTEAYNCHWDHLDVCLWSVHQVLPECR
jgi:hypothetical protein